MFTSVVIFIIKIFYLKTCAAFAFITKGFYPKTAKEIRNSV